jgi:hypothetical protein
MFMGTWEFPSDYIGNKDIHLYKWIARLSYSILLETFTFISGFLFVFQIKKYSIWILVKMKFFRLLLPCIIWGGIYAIALQKVKTEFFLVFLYNVVNGIGHLWFLPMLFSCFIIGYVLLKYIHNSLVVIFLGLCLPVIGSIYPIHFFRLNLTLKYLLYFIIGYYICFYKDRLLDIFMKYRYITILFGLYIAIFIFYYYLNDFYEFNNVLLSRSINYVLTIIYTFSGIFAFYLLINILLKKSKIKLPYMFYASQKYTFGIYIFHQMILDFIFYHTSVSQFVNIAVLPFIGMIITSFVSFIFVKYLLHTRMKNILL